MASSSVFDQSHYDALNTARVTAIRELLESLQKECELRTAVDVGCGLGYFAVFVRDLGFDVLALDGWQENVEEAKRRAPEIEFRLANAEDKGIQALGKFDLVLCLGLLYHLENPFAAIRNLFALTGSVALLEGMCIPGDEPVFAVRDEGPTEDQGLHHVALYPSENALVKLLYRAGFPHVYRLRKTPPHRDYESSLTRKRVRTMLLATIGPASSHLLVRAAEPATTADPWTIRNVAAALTLRALLPLFRLWRDPMQK